jgi:hypothetical protein
VTQPFLLQQAAWLYERHFQHVKAQMNKLRTSNAPTPTITPVPGVGAPQNMLGGVAMKRLGSNGGKRFYGYIRRSKLIVVASRAPSALSIRSRDSPVPRVDGSVPGTPRTGGEMALFQVIGSTRSNEATAPPLSRTPSTNTVTQSRHFLPPSPRQPIQRSFRTSNPAPPRKIDTTSLPVTTEAATSISSPASSSSSDSSSDSETAAVKRSQMFRRPPQFNQHKIKKSTLSNVDDLEDESSDDEDSSTFLPFAKTLATTKPLSNEDPSATLRDVKLKTDSRTPAPPREKPPTDTLKESEQSSPGSPAYAGKGKGKAPALNRMESSASSASSAPISAHGHKKRLDALSPRHRAELARLSPRRRATSGKGGDPGSDGTPSMGSSFSDLDGKFLRS